jgi:WhiB family redox-sensing transcriptional regulator
MPAPHQHLAIPDLAEVAYEILYERPWTADALCLGSDVELFFPEQYRTKEDIEQAKAVCLDCPVRLTCLEYAVDNRIKEGVWGGMTRRERQAWNKRRTIHLEAA